MIRTVLALDLSTRTGWAFGSAGSGPVHGVWLLGKMSEGGRVFSCLMASLQDAIAVHQPDLVIMEAPLPPQAQTAANTARLQFGLAAHVETVCFEHGVRLEEERAGDVRRAVLGTFRADKSTIIEWCQRQGWTPAEDNDADALVLLRYRLDVEARRHGVRA